MLMNCIGFSCICLCIYLLFTNILKRALIGIMALLIGLGGIKETQAFTIDFEGLVDLTPVTNQYSSLGVDFLGATVLTAGVSLNEFEFPPYSGSNVVYDESGPITVNFSIPMLDVGGYFTYLYPVTITAYDISNSIVDTITSSYFSNTALSGDPGSSPNEFLQVAYAGGISWVEMAGDPIGGSFTMDDFGGTPVPEPATLLLLGSGLAGLVGWRKTKRVH
jgi:hypothetical protein